MKFVSIFCTIALLLGLFLGTVSAQEISDEEELALGIIEKSPETSYELKLRNNFIYQGEIPIFDSQILQSIQNEKSTEDVLGTLPEIKTNEERQNWLSKLDEIRIATRDDMKPYLYPKGPVVSYGWDVDGYFKVVFTENKSSNKFVVNEIYALVAEEGKKRNLEDIPVVFSTVEKNIVDTKSTPIDYDCMFRPVIGGTKLQIYKSGGYYSATSGFAAEEDDGTLGYVTAKHFANQTGLQAYQPVHNYGTGTVSTISTGTNADASFIEYSDVSSDIHLGSSIWQCIENSRNPWVGLTVYKSGKSTGVTSGTVTGLDDTVYLTNGDVFYNQISSTYDSSSGDSGSPVYYMDAGEITLVGTHMSSNVNEAHFCPIGGIETDLDVTPILDWNPWNNYNSLSGAQITTAEIQEAVSCWLNDIPAPITGEEVNTSRLQLLVSFWQTGWNCKISSAQTITSLSKSVSGDNDNEFATASRVILINSKNSDAVQVIVNITVSDDTNILLLSEEIPTGCKVIPVENDGAIFKKSSNEWIWLDSLSKGENRRIIYEINTSDAKTCISQINGTVSAFGRSEIVVSDDNKITG